MSHRGLTLLELLASLCLMSLLVVAASQWTLTTMRLTRHLSQQDMARSVAERTLAVLANDLRHAISKPEPPGQGARSGWQMTIVSFEEEEGLKPIDVKWEFDEPSSELWRRVEHSPEDDRLVLAGLTMLTIEELTDERSISDSVMNTTPPVTITPQDHAEQDLHRFKLSIMIDGTTYSCKEVLAWP